MYFDELLIDIFYYLKKSDEQWSVLSKEIELFGKPYERLSRVMLGILTIPHSNASCEHIFNIVRRNKTDFINSMNLSTLQAVLIAKLQITGACYSQVYNNAFLKRAKSATAVALKRAENKLINIFVLHL